MRINKNYNEQNSLSLYSPDRAEKITQNNSSFAYKRSSINVDLDKPVDNIKINNYYKNYQNVDLKSRIASKYKPLDLIQNREQDMNAEIDRKIAEIRKKYQEYTKQPESFTEKNKI